LLVYDQPIGIRHRDIMFQRTLISIFTAVALTLVSLAVPAFAEEQTVQIHEGARVPSWGYTPMSVTVTVGDSVTWENVGDQPHTATADDGSWDTDVIDPGDSASIAFDTAGKYTYYCVPHPWMKGTVIVIDLVESN
jgi:plastocyanin